MVAETTEKNLLVELRSQLREPQRIGALLTNTLLNEIIRVQYCRLHGREGTIIRNSRRFVLTFNPSVIDKDSEENR